MKILILDDEKIILDGLRIMILSHLNLDFEVEVYTALNVEEALSYITPVTMPDLIFTDICLPARNGFDFIAVVKELNINCDIVVISSHSNVDYMKSAIHYHVTEFLSKPINTDALRSIIQSSHQKIEQYNTRLEKNELQKIRSMILFDFDMNDCYFSISVLQKILPYRLYTLILFHYSVSSCKDLAPFKVALEKCIPVCHVFRYAQHQHIIALCNHDKPISSSVINQTISSGLPVGMNYAVSLSSTDITALHQLYMNVQQKLFFKETFHEETRIPAMSISSYQSCVYLFTAPNDDILEERLDYYLRKMTALNPDLTQGSNFLNEIYKSFLYNMNAYLKDMELELEFTIPCSDDFLPAASPDNLKQLLKELICEKKAQLKSHFKNTQTQENIIKMLDYINTYYMNDISLKDVAEALNMHPNYVCTLFKTQLNNSFLNCLHSKRIAEAKTMLVNEPNLSIAEISCKSGYTSPNQFNRVFKKYTGKTPGELRKSL